MSCLDDNDDLTLSFTRPFILGSVKASSSVNLLIVWVDGLSLFVIFILGHKYLGYPRQDIRLYYSFLEYSLNFFFDEL